MKKESKSVPASRSMVRLLAVATGVAATVASAGAQDGPQFLVSDYTGDKIVRFDYPSGQPFDHFVGSGISILDDGLEMAYGPDGNLYIASWRTNSVLRYHGQTGRFLNTFVTVGSGELNGPRGLAFGPDGDLYVASGGTNSVLRFDGGTGEFVGEAVPAGTFGLAGPIGVLFDDRGRLYVSGYDSNNVLVVPPGGSPTVLVSSGESVLFRPTQMAIGPDEALVVASQGSSASAVRFDRMTGQTLGILLPAGAGGLGAARWGLVMMPTPPAECRADFDGDGQLTIFDFLAFQNAFDAGCP